MKSDKSTPNVPTLRFKKYSDTWQETPFDSTFDILTNNTLSRAELNNEDGTYKNIHYGDILIKFPAHIDVGDREVPFVNEDSSSVKFDDALLQDGDIVIADTAEDYTVGKATEIENSSMRKVVSGLHTIPCRPKMKFAARYLGYYINSPAYHNQLIPYIQGVKVSSVSKTLIKNTSISYPSYGEQSKIAEFLSALDSKIETQNKIISKYESLIKGLCEYIIKIASGYPIRLGEISTIYQPQTITQAELSENGDYPVFGANGIIGYYHQFNHEKAQIIITCRGSTCGTVNMSAPNSWITGNSMVVNVDGYEGIVDKLYLFYYLKTISFKSMISGSGQPQIVRKPLVDLLISLPELNTQVKYRSIIDTIYKKLVKEKDMLSRLTDLKAYLLSNLFI